MCGRAGEDAWPSRRCRRRPRCGPPRCCCRRASRSPTSIRSTTRAGGSRSARRGRRRAADRCRAASRELADVSVRTTAGATVPSSVSKCQLAAPADASSRRGTSTSAAPITVRARARTVTSVRGDLATPSALPESCRRNRPPDRSTRRPSRVTSGSVTTTEAEPSDVDRLLPLARARGDPRPDARLHRDRREARSRPSIDEEDRRSLIDGDHRDAQARRRRAASGCRTCPTEWGGMGLGHVELAMVQAEAAQDRASGRSRSTARRPTRATCTRCCTGAPTSRRRST